MTIPYSPSSGSEGIAFLTLNCDLCKDGGFRSSCQIMNWMREKIPEHGDYWVCDDDGTGARCLEFRKL